MALNQLLKIGKHAIKIHNMIDDSAEMEAWVAKKIDLAGDYVKKVHGYMQGEKAGLYDDGGLTEDAPFGSGMDLLRMAIMKKFISVQEWDLLKHKWKDAATEVEEKYSDWPEGEGFGSSDHNFAIRDLMTAVGYEFDDKDTSGRFVVTKQPEEIEKAGIKNARMRDAVATEDAGAMDWSTDKVREFGDDLIKVSKGQVPDDLLNIDDLEDGWADADQASRDQKAETIGGQLISVLIGYLQFSAGQKPSAEDIKGAQEVANDPEFKKAYHSTESVSEDAGEGHMSKSTLYLSLIHI